MSNNSNQANETLVKILKIGIYLVALIPLVIFKDYISPFHFGKIVVFRSIIEIMAVFYFILVLRDRSYLPHKHPLFLAISGWVLLFGITTITSVNRYLSFWGSLERMGGFWSFFHFFVFYVILVTILKNKEDWLSLFKVTIFVGLISSLYGFCQKTDIEFCIGSGGRLRIFGTIGNAALFAGYELVVMFLSGTLLFSYWIPKSHRKYYAIGVVVMGISILMTAVRGALLGMLVGVIVFAFLYAMSQKSKYAKRVFWGFIISTVLFINFSFLFKDTNFIKNSRYLVRITDISFKSYTVQTRFWAWSAGITGWKENPKTILIGWGPENFNVPFSKYFNPKFYDGPGSETLFDRAHNMFVEILVTMGLITLLAYLFVFFVAFRLIWKFVIFVPRKIPEDDAPQDSENEKRVPGPMVGVGLFSLLVAYVVHNFFFFDTSANFVVFFTVMGFITYLTPIHSPKKEILPVADPGQAPKETKDENKNLSAGHWTMMVILLTIVSVLIYNTNVLPAKSNYTTTRAILKSWTQDFNGTLDKYTEALAYDVHGKYEIRNRFAQYVLNLTGNRKIEETEEALLKIAIEEVTKNAVETNQDYIPYLYISRLNTILGKNDRNSPHNDESIKNALIALDISPTFVRVYYELAQAYLNKGDNAKAVEYFEKAVDLNPEVGISHWYLGMTYVENGDIQKGLDSINKAIERRYKPIEEDHIRLIDVYIKVNNLQGIKESYEKLIEINPGNPQYFASLAVAYANLGEFEKAIESARQAVVVDEDFEDEARAFIESLGAIY